MVISVEPELNIDRNIIVVLWSLFLVLEKSFKLIVSHELEILYNFKGVIQTCTYLIL